MLYFYLKQLENEQTQWTALLNDNNVFYDGENPIELQVSDTILNELPKKKDALNIIYQINCENFYYVRQNNLWKRLDLDSADIYRNQDNESGFEIVDLYEENQSALPNWWVYNWGDTMNNGNTTRKLYILKIPIDKYTSVEKESLDSMGQSLVEQVPYENGTQLTFLEEERAYFMIFDGELKQINKATKEWWQKWKKYEVVEVEELPNNLQEEKIYSIKNKNWMEAAREIYMSVVNNLLKGTVSDQDLIDSNGEPIIFNQIFGSNRQGSSALGSEIDRRYDNLTTIYANFKTLEQPDSYANLQSLQSLHLKEQNWNQKHLAIAVFKNVGIKTENGLSIYSDESFKILRVGNQSFYGAKINWSSLPEGVFEDLEIIQTSGFENSNLKNFLISKKCTNISQYAFKNSLLEEITFENSNYIEDIERNITISPDFLFNTNVNSILFPDRKNQLESSIFRGSKIKKAGFLNSDTTLYYKTVSGTLSYTFNGAITLEHIYANDKLRDNTNWRDNISKSGLGNKIVYAKEFSMEQPYTKDTVVIYYHNFWKAKEDMAAGGFYSSKWEKIFD